METKVRAIVVSVIVIIILFIALAVKIKSDYKRKSSSNYPSEGEKDINNAKNDSQVRKKGIWGIPSWGLALITMFLAFVGLMVVADLFNAIFRIPESDIVDLIFYILYNLIIAGGCFFICRQDPKSIWYVPLLCNILGIISAIIEPNFWISSLWIVICSGWVLSIIVSITGARIGKNKSILVNQ